MKAALEVSSGLELIYSCTTATALLQQLPIQQPDILLLDIRLPDMDGTRLCKVIREQYPLIRILVVTSHDDPWYVKQMFDIGVHGYLLKDSSFNILETAIQAVMQGKQFLDSRIQFMFDDSDENGKALPLIRKEKEILQLLAQQRSLQQIAGTLNIPLRMAEMHFFNLTQKLGNGSLEEMLAIASQRGLL